MALARIGKLVKKFLGKQSVQAGFAMICTLFLVRWIYYEYGTPATIITYLALCGIILWTLLLAFPIHGRKRILFGLVPVLFFTYVFACEGEYIRDTHGGRNGFEIWPLRFCQTGINTALLEQYLGKLEPQWKHAGTRANIFTTIFTTIYGHGDRIDGRSIIRSPDLKDILALLPTHEARCQVLRCVTDRQNLARVHQGLLLVCLKEWGYPPGYDTAKWWKTNSHIFQPHKISSYQSKELEAFLFLRELRSQVEKSPQYRWGDNSEIDRQLKAAALQEPGGLNNW